MKSMLETSDQFAASQLDRNNRKSMVITPSARKSSFAFNIFDNATNKIPEENADNQEDIKKY